MTFSPDNRELAVGTDNGSIRHWDLVAGKTTRVQTGFLGNAITAFSPDGAKEAAVSTAALESPFDNPVLVWSAAYRRGDGPGVVWNIADDQSVTRLAGHTNGVQKMEFSPDGKYLAAGAAGDGGPVRLWEVATGRNVGTFSGGYDLTFSPDSRTLAIGGSWSPDGHVRLVNTATGSLSVFPGLGDPVAFSPDSRNLAVSDDGGGTIYDVASGNVMFRVPSHVMAFSPGGATLATGHLYDVELLDAHTGKLDRALTGHTDKINDLVFSPDGQTVASASSDKTVRLWHLTG